MKKDEATARLARQVSVALGEMLENSPGRPRGVDPFDWSSDVLDELARAVATIGRVVDRLAGPPAEDASDPATDTEHRDAIDTLARELATAIVRRRNSLIVPGATHRARSGQVLPAPPDVHHA